MAVNWLAGGGFSREQAIRAVARRVHRLDVQRLLPVVSRKDTSASSPPIRRSS
jgi:hypothetical protein